MHLVLMLYLTYAHLCVTQVQIYLSDKQLPDLDALDAHLREFLSLAELRADMESFRDEIIEYYLQDEQMPAVAEEGQGQAEDKNGRE